MSMSEVQKICSVTITELEYTEFLTKNNFKNITFKPEVTCIYTFFSFST